MQACEQPPTSYFCHSSYTLPAATPRAPRAPLPPRQPRRSQTDAPQIQMPQVRLGGRRGGRQLEGGGPRITQYPRRSVAGAGENPGRGRGGGRPGACGTRCPATAARRLPFTTLSVVDNLGSIALGSDISSRRGTATRRSSVLLHTDRTCGPDARRRRRRRAAHRSAEVWALRWL